MAPFSLGPGPKLHHDLHVFWPVCNLLVYMCKLVVYTCKLVDYSVNWQFTLVKYLRRLAAISCRKWAAK